MGTFFTFFQIVLNKIFKSVSVPLFIMFHLHWMLFSFIPSRCEEICTGVAVMGSSTNHVDYHFPALQSRVGGGGRLSLLYNSTGHSLRFFPESNQWSMTVDQRIFLLKQHWNVLMFCFAPEAKFMSQSKLTGLKAETLLRLFFFLKLPLAFQKSSLVLE